MVEFLLNNIYISFDDTSYNCSSRVDLVSTEKYTKTVGYPNHP